MEESERSKVGPFNISLFKKKKNTSFNIKSNVSFMRCSTCLNLNFLLSKKTFVSLFVNEGFLTYTCRLTSENLKIKIGLNVFLQ